MFYLLTFRIKPYPFIQAKLFEPTAPGKLNEVWMKKELIREYKKNKMTLSRVKIRRLPSDTTLEDARKIVKTYPRPIT